MTDVVGTPPRPNPLAHPTLREDELCHIATRAVREGGSGTLCGAAIPDEPDCCGLTTRPCGRPRCPECSARFHEVTGGRRP